MKKSLGLMVRASFLFVYILSFVFPTQSASAAATLVIQEPPLTWNVIGLDSNNVKVGPNHFPVGARVCNNGNELAENVQATLTLGASLYVSIRGEAVLDGPDLAVNQCYDFYFEVEVDRDADARGTTVDYEIEIDYNSVSAPGVPLSVSTPAGYELFVEFLVSQNRNAVTDVSYGTTSTGLASVAPGGTMNLIVGNTYYIQMDGYTATQGYEQLETFINFPNTIFQVLSVKSTYTASSSTHVDGIVTPHDKLYADGCLWENDKNDPNYRSCLDVGKAGGTISILYEVKILQVPAAPFVNPEPLSTLIYDFSGSSYHYNADYSVSTRYANIISPATISKSFSPNTIAANGTSTLTYTIKNISSNTLTGLNFADTTGWPAGLTVSGDQSITYTGCGLSTSPASVTNGQSSITFSGIQVAANSTCTFSVLVTSAVDGTYLNTTNNLLIGTNDTGSKASASLVVSSSPPLSGYTCTSGEKVRLVAWNFNAGDGGTDANPTFTASTRASDVNAAVLSATATAGTGGTISRPATTGSTSGANVWQIIDGWKAVQTTPTSATSPYFNFVVDTSNYTQVEIRASYNLDPGGDWANPGDNKWFVHTAANGGTFTDMTTGQNATKGQWVAYNGTNGLLYQASTTGSSTTTFRLNFLGAKSQAQANPAVLLDDVQFYGCRRPTPPELSKDFSPTSIGSDSSVPPANSVNYSTLTFTVRNTTAAAITGVEFVDTLPDGLVIANPPTVTRNTCSTGSGNIGGTITAAAGSSLIELTGGTVPAGVGTTCTFSVRVQGKAAGDYTNTSNRISADFTGPNMTGGADVGYGVGNLTVVAAPVINKAFTANPIFTGETTLLTFNIRNPNASASLSNLAFTDNLPVGLVVDTTTTAPDTPVTNTCGGTFAPNNGDNSVTLSGTNTLLAGATCTITVRVRGTTVGLKENSVQATSSNGGTSNTAEADVLVKDKTPRMGFAKYVGLSSIGPWVKNLNVTLPDTVYYLLYVENTGDVPLTNITVTDASVSAAGCTWINGNNATISTNNAAFTLPVVSSDPTISAHYATCILGEPGGITAQDGANTNTASADPAELPASTSQATYTGFAPNLVLTKTDNPVTAVTAGGTTTYTLTVTNNGNVPTSGPVTVVDAPPTGLTVTAISGTGWTCNLGTLTCNRSDALAAGSSYDVITVNATVSATATGPLVNKAKVGGGGDPTNSAAPDNASTLLCTANGTPEGCAIDSNELNALTIDKDTSTPNVIAGGTASYTIVVTNTGTTTLTGAVISDTLPAGFTYTSTGTITTTGVGTIRTATNDPAAASPTPSWDTWTIAPGGSVTIPFTVNVGVGVTAGTYNNTAGVTTTEIPGPIYDNGTVPTDEDVTVAVLNAPAITKAFSPATIESGSASTITFTLTNPNAVVLTGATFTDTLTNMSVSSTTIGGTCVGVTNNPALAVGATVLDLTVPSLPTTGCTITIEVTSNTVGVHPNTTSGVDTNETSVGSPSNTANLTVVTIDAVNDSGVTVNGTAGGQSFANVLTNDSLNGTSPVDIADVDLTQVSTTNAGVTLNTTDGSVNVAAGTPAGNYVVTYQICDMLNPTVCDTATVTVPVVTIDAVNDSGVTVNGTAGGQSFANVLTNDSLNGTSPVDIADVDLTQVSTTNAGVTLNTTDGSVNVAAGTPAGNYVVTYQICDTLNPTVCDTATVTVPVVDPAIVTNKTDTLFNDVNKNGLVEPGDTIRYTVTITNTGTGDATGVTFADAPDVNTTLVVESVTTTQGTVTTGNTAGDTTVLVSIGTVTSGGGSATVTFDVTVKSPLVSGVTEVANQGTVTGTNIPNTLTDDPDTPTPGDPTRTPVVQSNIFDPPSALKTFNEVGLPELEFRMVWINNSNITAINVQITDNIPTGTTYVPNSVVCLPLGASTNAATASSPLSATAVPNSFCGFDAANNRIQWQGSIAPDPGIVETDPNAETLAANEVVITFRVTVNDGVNQVLNIASSRTDTNNNGNFDEEQTLGTSIVNSNQVIWNRSVVASSEPEEEVELPVVLPATGFAPNRITVLPEQPAQKAYRATEVWLEVPRLGVKMPIVGVPLAEGDWDVSWLWNEAGWLEGTAFPSWAGNSVLTSHVTLPNGKDGPFAQLGKLKWGDRIIVHAYGMKYTYEVRQNRVVSPTNTSVLKHEDDPWLTLLTCKTYNESTGEYSSRIAVRAVLIGTKESTISSGTGNIR